MDSITQFALGSSVALATIGRQSARRSATWQVALIGGMVGTLPDLDAFVDFGDAISNMIRHRAETHGLFYLTLGSPLIGFLITRLQGDRALFGRWSLVVWLILVTHVGIDFLTIYGTQLAQPFTSVPYGIGSLFVIDPLYTLPLIVGVIGAVVQRGVGKWRWNAGGLAFSTAYILWSLGAHQYVTQIARNHPPTPNESAPLLVTAAPLNTILWRAVVISADHYHEGWYSFFDSEPRFHWRAYPLNSTLTERYQSRAEVSQIAAFSHGFYKIEQDQGRLFVTDLRLGLEPFYSFRFDLGPIDSPTTALRVGVRPDLKMGLPWLWHRIKGNPVTFSDYANEAARK
jgi:inner membrane protein